MVGLWCYTQSGVTELLIMRNPHYGRMCFKSVKTLGAVHSWLWKRPRPSVSAFSTAKNVELLGLYPIHNSRCSRGSILITPSHHTHTVKQFWFNP